MSKTVAKKDHSKPAEKTLDKLFIEIKSINDTYKIVNFVQNFEQWKAKILETSHKSKLIVQTYKANSKSFKSLLKKCQELQKEGSSRNEDINGIG